MKNRFVATAGCLTAFGISTWGHAEGFPQIAIRGGDAGTVVYDYAREHCAEWDTPDAPLRAYRDARGGVTAFVSDADSRMFKGKSLLDLHHTCHSSFKSRKNPDPAAYANEGYVTATWTSDGIAVTALIHQEYHADEFPKACRYQDSMACWYNTIVGAQSQDGGLTFATTQPPTIVASVPFRQDFEQGRHRGFFNPSNIVFHDGYYYMASETTGGGVQKDGLCLFRTSTVAEPNSWRGYDGHGYGSRAIDPYRGDTRAYLPCEPIEGPGTASSLSWYQAGGLFLVVYQDVDASHPNGYIAYAWSRDLIHWSDPQVLYAHPDMSSKNCADRYRFAYPSIADPQGPGQNFDSIGDHPVMFLTRFHVVDCDLPPNRDLIRLQLDVVRR